jgi:hypothetical protein
MQGYKKILYTGVPTDEFGNRVREAISQIELQLKPHLKR